MGVAGPGAGALEGLLAGAQGIGTQLLLWSVLGQIVGSVMGPISEEIQQQIFKVLSNTPLSPQDAADAVLKGWMDQPTAAAEAVLSGVSAQRFQTLLDIAGEPPGIEQMMEAGRRGIIPFTGAAGVVSVQEAVRQSRLRPEWFAVLEALQWLPLPVADLVNAQVRGQIDPATAVAGAAINGIKAEDFTVLVNTAGRPPAPEQLLTLYRRGLIPLGGTGPGALTVQQGIYEGDLKDKWWSLVSQLSEYLPPPRTVTALERSGAITPAQASTLYQQSGLSAELAAAYSASASSTKVAKTKELAESQVVKMYEDRILTAAEATTFLEAIGYSADEVTLILELADMTRSLAAVQKAINRVGTQFVARKIGAATARNDLGALGLDSAHIDQLMQTWSTERNETVRLLTAAELTDAYAYAVIDQATAQDGLEALGYTPYDAWVLLSVKAKAPLPNPPAIGATITGQEP